MQLTSKIATATLAIAITFGGAAAAMATGLTTTADGASGGRHRPTLEQICAHQDQIVSRLTERQSHLTDRIARLNQLTTKVTNADKLAKIGQRITTLQTRLDRVTERIAAAPEWIAAHCS